MRPIDTALLDALAQQAAESPRRRANHDFHEASDPVQRMLNAVRDDSYVRPHRHADPDKVELFVPLTGRMRVLTFTDEGLVVSCLDVGPLETVRGVEIPPRTWHALLAMEPVVVMLEIIQGPYDPATHKKFAPWSPDDDAAGLVWLREKAGL